MKSEPDKELILKRTEEVQDIVDRMPTRGARYVLGIVLGLVVLMSIFGFIIRYPEVVRGPVIITTGKTPVKLVAKSSGQLLLLDNETRQEVKKQEIFAIIENTAVWKDIVRLDSMLALIQKLDSIPEEYCFPQDLDLGELNSGYYRLVEAFEEKVMYEKINKYEVRQEAYELQLKQKREAIEFGQSRLKIKRKQLDFYKREVSRDSFLFKIGDSVERDVERTQYACDGILESFQTLVETINQLEADIKVIRNQLLQLDLERQEYEHDLKINLRNACNDLQTLLKQWKDRYAFVAPFEGYVEFLDFWQENDFVQSGVEVFSVIPSAKPIEGHLLLPSQGAGKVKPGQEVTIKLNDYPYLEYGALQGQVKDISWVTNQTRFASESTLDTYLVTIEMPDGLKTKFGSTLDFRYEIKGTAEVKTRKRRLIERLFDNLKYMTN